MTLQLTNVSVGYGKTPLLTGIQLSCSPGEVYALVAKNGRGKSTLLSALECGSTLMRGSVSANGEPLGTTRYKQLVFYANTDPTCLIPTLRLEYQLKLASHYFLNCLPYQEVAAALGASHLLSKLPKRMSQGERQLASLVLAASISAPYTLLDEPTNALDATHRSKAHKLIRTLASRGTCVIYTSHLKDSIQNTGAHVIQLG